MAYLMDSNAFIQAKNQFYRFSFCPGFWDWIAGEHSRANLFSVEMVETELKQGSDELAEWVSNDAPGGLFITPSAAVATTQGVVARWVNAQKVYAPSEQARFLSRADPWLIAEAIERGHEIITFEEIVPPNSSKVKIPNVAANFGVKCVSLFDALEVSGMQMRL
jgi:hypothetical protein